MGSSPVVSYDEQAAAELSAALRTTAAKLDTYCQARASLAGALLDDYRGPRKDDYHNESAQQQGQGADLAARLRRLAAAIDDATGQVLAAQAAARAAGGH